MVSAARCETSGVRRAARLTDRSSGRVSSVMIAPSESRERRGWLQTERAKSTGWYPAHN